MIVLKLIIWLTILLVVMSVSIQNVQEIELKYYIFNFDNFNFEPKKAVPIQLFVILLGTLLSGFLLASLFIMVNNIRLKNLIRKQKQTIKNLDKKITKLTLNYTQPYDEQAQGRQI